MKTIFLTISFGLLYINSFSIQTIGINDIITRQLVLEFNEEAKEADSYITWALKGEWDLFEVSFSQGVFKGNTYTIKAAEYEPFLEGKDGIVLELAPTAKTRGGNYSLSMEIIEVSENLGFEKPYLDLSLHFTYEAPPPTPWWLTLIYVLFAVFVLFHIFWFAFLKRNLYPKMAGILQFSDGSTIKLNDCYNYILYTSHKKPAIAKGGMLSEIYCGKKGSFQMPYPEEHRSDSKYILIKPVKARKGYLNSLDKIQGIELLSNNKKLYHQEEYSFKDANDDMVVNFVYDNEKHQM